MDYAGLINLTLITIVYSTFIAPSIKKLGSIRDDISNIKFPILDSGDVSSSSEYTIMVAEFNGKLTQYEDKYNEINEFLFYFYACFVTLICIQIGVLTFKGELDLKVLLSVFGITILSFIIFFTIKNYMTPPSEIRSARWLAKRGLAPAHINRLLSPELAINDRPRNHKNTNPGMVTFNINTNSLLLGFGVILLIENQDSSRLYSVFAGSLKKNVATTPVVYGDGRMKFKISLGGAKLQPSQYKARLLTLHAPFEGTYYASETTIDFKVEDDGTKSVSEKIDLNPSNSNYEITVINDEIIKLSFKESFQGDTNIVSLLSNPKFLKSFNQFNRPFVIRHEHGILDRHEIGFCLSKINVTVKKIRRLIIPRLRKYPYLNLSMKTSISKK